MRWLLSLALIAVSTMATAGAAHAAPVNDETVTITLYDCTGPAGTPSSFDITKIPNAGAALHLVNGTGTFVLYSGTDETTGLLVFTTPGMERNNPERLVTCRFVSPLNGHTYRVSGQITPASG
jgi:hypothetical protein